MYVRIIVVFGLGGIFTICPMRKANDGTCRENASDGYMQVSEFRYGIALFTNLTNNSL